ncbi:major facilitator superfamily domain-containing protein [Phakopsora pachyrhizi]|uniref:Major facilitator superfamily domain-containing protein n=1 Tax=Phakopsora pachyrhizi TaxID=170000 RepID=A0AAV0AIE7_PHAPC|nr:major facilitator superfamily domain-containing protein [Phakopsora pachyrhizi]CAH7667154.1 major facilitator superfamily domain-containing protein [Phakopsora pachyrhizi]
MFISSQLLILCIIRLCEPISFTVIFPMVAFMISEAEPRLSEKQIGFYSGSIESIFSLSQFLTIILWGKLSDRIGRRPVLSIGLIGVFLSTLTFGLSKTFSQMMFSRALGGILNGNAAVIKSMVGEITSQDKLALAFSLLPTFFAIGSIIGPVLGGYLSQPSQKFPNSWFGRSQFWIDHPWLLPCLVAGLFPLIGFALSLFALEETLPARKPENPERRPLLESDDDEGAIDDQSASPQGLSKSNNSSDRVFELLKDKNLVMILVNYSILSFQTIGLDALIVLFAFTPIKSGGIGFTTSQIGETLSIAGIFTLLIQVFLFPRLQKYLGTVKLYRICMSSYPIIFLLFPIINQVALIESRIKEEVKRSSHLYVGVWIGVLALMGLKTLANMVFSCNMLLVNGSAPTRDSLGTVNGLAQCCASFARAISPMVSSSLFSISIINYKFLSGYTIFYGFSLVGLVGFYNSFRIKE